WRAPERRGCPSNCRGHLAPACRRRGDVRGVGPEAPAAITFPLSRRPAARTPCVVECLGLRRPPTPVLRTPPRHAAAARRGPRHFTPDAVFGSRPQPRP